MITTLITIIALSIIGGILSMVLCFKGLIERDWVPCGMAFGAMLCSFVSLSLFYDIVVVVKKIPFIG